MAYVYKKDFFGSWKKKKGISTAEIGRVLNFNSPDKIRIWAGEKELAEVNSTKLKDEERGWIPLKHILRLCNHYGLKISDFIENAEEPAQPKRQKTEGSTDNRHRQQLTALQMELLQTKLDHQQEINALQAQYREREDRIRAQYDTTIQELMKHLSGSVRTKEDTSSMVNDETGEPVYRHKRG